jgi:hypothetical protein
MNLELANRPLQLTNAPTIINRSRLRQVRSQLNASVVSRLEVLVDKRQSSIPLRSE